MLCNSVADRNVSKRYRLKYRFSLALLAIIFVLLLSLSHRLNCEAAIPDIVLKQQNAVVMIEITDNNGKRISLGTGFIINSSGIIVTNYHVISEWFESTNKGAIAKMENGALILLEGAIAIDRNNDIALIRSRAKHLPIVRINRNINPKKGENVYVIGSPLGLESTVSEGIISSLRGGDETEIIQITATISPGSSGSPVYNSRGEVIGVATFQAKGGQNLNFAVPISKALSLFDTHRHGTVLPKPVPSKRVEVPESALKPDLHEETKAETLYRKGLDLLKTNNYIDAMNAFTEAIEINPKHWGAYHCRGWTYEKIGAYRKCIKDFDKSLMIEPKQWKAFLFRGNCYVQLKFYQLGIYDYNKALELAPNAGVLYNNRGLAYGRMGGHDDLAIADIKKAASLGYEDAKAFLKEIRK